MEKKPTILVTGSNGQLGSELRELAPFHPAYEFLFLTRNELPLNDSDKVKAVITDYRPDFVVNCAAYTAVDKAETEKEEAFQINAAAVGAMSEACNAAGAKFIHISTDYVFDGSSREAIKEDSQVNPINMYGQTKLDGEVLAQEKNPDVVIIRTSWVYSYHGKNFVKTMIRLMAEKESINVVEDQIGSPTYAADLAAAILHIIETKKWQPGIYHFSNEGTISWFEFAREIGIQIQTGCQIYPITTANFPTPAKRPLFSVMDKTKISQTFGIIIRDWKQSLSDCLQKFKENQSFH